VEGGAGGAQKNEGVDGSQGYLLPKAKKVSREVNSGLLGNGAKLAKSRRTWKRLRPAFQQNRKTQDLDGAAGSGKEEKKPRATSVEGSLSTQAHGKKLNPPQTKKGIKHHGRQSELVLV